MHQIRQSSSRNKPEIEVRKFIYRVPNAREVEAWPSD